MYILIVMEIDVTYDKETSDTTLRREESQNSLG